HIRRHAFKGVEEPRAERTSAVRTDDPRDMGAVTILVRCCRPRHEALAINDARSCAGGILQIVPQGDAAVDYGHAYTGSGVAVLPGEVGIDGSVGDVERACRPPVRRDVGDVRTRSQHRYYKLRQLHVYCFNAGQVLLDLAVCPEYGTWISHRELELD